MTESLRTKRKVLVLAPSLKSIGGIQNYTGTLVNALQVVLGSDRVRMVAVPGDPEMQDDGSFALRPSVKARFLSSAITDAISWSHDLMICAHVGLAPTARLIQRLTGVRFWVVLYGIEVWGDLPATKRSALQAAQRYVAITRFTLDATVARHGLKTHRDLILPPTLPKWRLPSPETDYQTSKGATGPMVLTVGRIAASERYKGHDVMLEAWPAVLCRVPDAVYWIVGSGDDSARLESRARDLGITDSVHFAGSVSPEELDVCYHRCCIFAMPARTELNTRVPRGEGFGIVFLEAMAHGKPVVGPSIGAPAEFIRSGEHGLLVDPTDSHEVAEALIELLEDPARAHRMGDAGREWVAREFSFDRFCERLRDALETQ
jgi:phosphatidylinositol alpha-1,6-mannosyltransferase